MAPRLSDKDLQVLRQAVQQWVESVEAAKLARDTRKTYIQHPERMLRWFEGEYHLPV